MFCRLKLDYYLTIPPTKNALVNPCKCWGDEPKKPRSRVANGALKPLLWQEVPLRKWQPAFCLWTCDDVGILAANRRSILCIERFGGNLWL